MTDLVYIIATRQQKGLPGMTKTCGNIFYYTYADAEADRQKMADDIREYFGVFTVHCIVQQEVTFEALF